MRTVVKKKVPSKNVANVEESRAQKATAINRAENNMRRSAEFYGKILNAPVYVEARHDLLPIDTYLILHGDTLLSCHRETWEEIEAFYLAVATVLEPAAVRVKPPIQIAPSPPKQSKPWREIFIVGCIIRALLISVVAFFS